MNRTRILVIVIALGVLALYILFQFARIMVFDTDGDGQPSILLPIVERGNIYDRNGKLLAGTVKLDTVSAWMPNVEDVASTAKLLSQTLNIEESALLQRMRDSDGFLYIKRKILPAESRAMKELLRSGALSGVQLQEEFGRVYPMENLGAHWLGFVGTDNVGLAGVEYSYNNVLMPTEINDRAFLQGSDVYLTMDSSLQYLVEEIAAKTLTLNKGDRITALVLHAPTGEMLAMTQLPGFPPSQFGLVTPDVRKNHMVETIYEPGSVFKIFSLSVLLESRAITTRSTYVCNGYYEKTAPNSEVIRIKCNGVHGVVDPMAILQVSCNSGIAQASDNLDPETFSNGLRAFGFGSATGAPFSGESEGILAPVNRWSYRTKPTVAFGQEIGLTALQLMQAATAVSNSGVLLKPHYVRRVLSPRGEIIYESVREEMRRVLTPETSTEMLEMLRASVDMGFGNLASIRGVEVGGKTGTSQVLDEETGTYSDSQFIASIMTFIPARKPEYIIYVAVNNPQGSSIHGGMVAAPAAREIAENLVLLYGVAREGDQILDHEGEIRVQRPSLPPIADTLPDYRGLAKRTLLPLLARDDIQVRFLGEGHVKKQDPPAGSPFQEGMTLTLEFE